MDATLIANLNNVIAKNEFLLSQREKANLYYEPDSPLNRAQKMSDSLRMRQQRKPMVLEYYKTPDQIESIEMYINPDNMQFSANKVNNKTYTRGGIFYHHWGDDLPILQISGNVGLAQMKGIEQLEKIYAYSGVLLRYQNAGIDVVNNGNQEDYEVIDFNSPYGPLEYVTSTNLDSDRISSIQSNSINTANNKYANYSYSTSDLKDVDIANYIISNFSYASQLNSDNVMINKVYLKLIEYQEKQIQSNGYCDFNNLYQYSLSVCTTAFNKYAKEIQVNLAFDLANSLNSNSNNIITNTTSNSYTDISNSKSKKITEQLTAVQNYNNNVKISREEILPGIADITDELTDQWRPRLIFIYFEDRVYIGHFDNFNYQRQASTPIITYSMKFTITRQILMTSTSENRKKPTTTQPVTKVDMEAAVDTSKEDFAKILEQIKAEASKGSIETATRYILQIKGEWRYEDDSMRLDDNGQSGLSNSKHSEYKNMIDQIHEAAKYNGSYLISLPNPLLDNVMYNADIYLEYFDYCLEKGHTFVKTIINAECRRIRKAVDAEYKKWNNQRKEQVEGWIVKIYKAIDGAKYNHYDLNYVIKLLKLSV